MRIGLNIGCGRDRRESTERIQWFNLDIDPSVSPDIVENVCVISDKWPNAVDKIVANDILEHVPLHCWKRVLRFWVSKLRPGGDIRIQVPNLGNIHRALVAGAIDEDTANRVIYGERTNEWDTHYQLFTNRRLEAALKECGLVILESRDLHVNIVVSARKP